MRVCVCDLVGSCCCSIYSYVGMCYVCCEYEQCEYSSYIIHLSSGSIKAKAIKKRKGNTSVALCCVVFVMPRMYLRLGYPLQCLGGKVRSCCKMWMWMWRKQSYRVTPHNNCQGSSHFAFGIVFHNGSYVAVGSVSISVSVYLHL